MKVVAQRNEIYLLAAIPLKDSAFTGITDSLYMVTLLMLLNSQFSLEVDTFLVVGMVVFLFTGMVTVTGTSLNSYFWLCNPIPQVAIELVFSLIRYVTMISQVNSQFRRVLA